MKTIDLRTSNDPKWLRRLKTYPIMERIEILVMARIEYVRQSVTFPVECRDELWMILEDLVGAGYVMSDKEIARLEAFYQNELDLIAGEGI